MSEFKTILCPTDFSENAEHAVVYSRALAQASGGTVHIANVVDLGHNQYGPVEGVYVSSADLHRSIEMIEEHAQEQMDHLVKKHGVLGLELTPHMLKGYTSEEIVKLSESIGADLIVVATHGRSGLSHMLFGSVCDKILRLSHAPVLAVKPHEREFVSEDGQAIRLKKIMCPVDFSDFSHAALPLAKQLARKFDASIELVHVVDARLDYPEWTAQAAVNNSAQLAESAEKELNELAETMDGIKTTVKVVVGISHTALINIVKDDNIDLVVMPSHGRKGITHALLGSVAEKVVRLAPSPVLVVRPDGA